MHYRCLFITLSRFVHDSASFPIQAESISVDASLNSIYRTRQQLNLPPLENQDTQPLSPIKQQSNMNNSNENSFSTDCVVQGNGNFRQRTSVMSSAEGKRYKSIRCKAKHDNHAPAAAVMPSSHDQHSCTVKTTSTSCRGNHSDKPPPLPPKPVGSTKLCTKKGSSNFSRSVYKCGEHKESSSLLEDRIPVQPSQLRAQQTR